MIEYVQAHNPDDRVIARAVTILENGGLVAYPTDSSWGIGCSSESKAGIEALSRLREDKKSQFSLICSSIKQMSEVSNIDTTAFKLIKQHTPGPYVFIMSAVKKIEKRINIKRPEIGMRIPDHRIPIRIVEELGAPIFSITAARDMIDIYNVDPEFVEENLFEYGWELEDIAGVELVVDTGEALEKRLSTVVRLAFNESELIRQGIGPWEV